jgi:hypothetical protein
MLAIRLDDERMSDWVSRCPRLKQLLELFAPVEDPENVHAPYIKWASLVPNDPEWHEATLERIAARAWDGFLRKIQQKLRTQTGTDHRHQFWEVLNESRGYVWLADHGYSEIEFIQEEANEKRADLLATSPTRAILEVKTINRSDADRQRERKRNDPAFLSDSITNLDGLVTKLTQKADPISSYIWGQLPEPSQELLLRFTPGSLETKQVVATLSENLRRIIEGPCIYGQMGFSVIPSEALQDLTTHLVREHLQGRSMSSGDLISLNRCLLDDAYPEDLCKWSQCLSVEVFRPDAPIPARFLKKLESTITTAKDQIETTLRNMHPVEKKIVLLIVNRDFGCSFVAMKQLEALLQKPDLHVVCQIGDF